MKDIKDGKIIQDGKEFPIDDVEIHIARLTHRAISIVVHSGAPEEINRDIAVAGSRTCRFRDILFSHNPY